MRIRPKEGGSGTDKDASASAGADVRNQVNTLRVTAAPATGQGYCSMSRSIPAGTAFPSEFCTRIDSARQRLACSSWVNGRSMRMGVQRQ